MSRRRIWGSKFWDKAYAENKIRSIGCWDKDELERKLQSARVRSRGEREFPDGRYQYFAFIYERRTQTIPAEEERRRK